MKKMATLILIQVLCLFLIFPPSMLLAAPKGGQVAAGTADIQQSGRDTNINQSSNRAVINWDSFDIGRGETVNHTMPGRDSAALHRVVGGRGASQLEGALNSNGNIFLVNPKGVVIHQGAKINTGGFVASTADIKNEDFMNGRMHFTVPGDPGAVISNQGAISVKDRGYAALVAPQVRNDGVIGAKLGKIALTSADTFKLDVYGDDLVNFAVSEERADQFYTTEGVQLGVANSGQIKAEGGVVLLTAKQLDQTVASTVNNSGLVEAGSAEMKGGKIVFSGQGEVNIENTGEVRASSAAREGGAVTMASAGQVKVAGTVEAKGKTDGGRVDISGGKKTEIAGADISAEGAAKGLIRLGGEFQGGQDKGASDELKQNFVGRFGQAPGLASSASLSISAGSNVTVGKNGTLVAWSDGLTEIYGGLAGNFVETSGKRFVMDSTPTISHGGHWLVDPTNVTIVAGDAAFDSGAEGNTSVGASWIAEQISNNSGLSIWADILIKVSAALSYTGDLGLIGRAVVIDAAINANNGSIFLDGTNYIKVNSNIDGSTIYMGGPTITIKDNVSISGNTSSPGGIRFGTFGFSPASDITIGENVKVQASGEIFFYGKNVEIKKGTQIMSTSDGDGRILFWGGLDPVTNDVNNPFESVKFGSGVQLSGQRGIEVYSKYTELLGASLATHNDESAIVIAGSRTRLPDESGEQRYELHPDSAIINMFDDAGGNISSLTSVGSIELAMKELNFGLNPKSGTRISAAHGLTLISAAASLINIIKGTTAKPTIKAGDVTFAGHGTFQLNKYSIKTKEVEYRANDDNSTPKILGTVGTDPATPDIFGIETEKPDDIDDHDWEDAIAGLKDFQKKYPSVQLGDIAGQPLQLSKTLENTLQEVIRNLAKEMGEKGLREALGYTNYTVTDKNIAEALEVYHKLQKRLDVYFGTPSPMDNIAAKLEAELRLSGHNVDFTSIYNQVRDSKQIELNSYYSSLSAAAMMPDLVIGLAAGGGTVTYKDYIKEMSNYYYAHQQYNKAINDWNTAMDMYLRQKPDVSEEIKKFHLSLDDKLPKLEFVSPDDLYDPEAARSVADDLAIAVNGDLGDITGIKTYGLEPSKLTQQIGHLIDMACAVYNIGSTVLSNKSQDNTVSVLKDFLSAINSLSQTFAPHGSKLAGALDKADGAVAAFTSLSETKNTIEGALGIYENRQTLVANGVPEEVVQKVVVMSTLQTISSSMQSLGAIAKLFELKKIGTVLSGTGTFSGIMTQTVAQCEAEVAAASQNTEFMFNYVDNNIASQANGELLIIKNFL